MSILRLPSWAYTLLAVLPIVFMFMLSPDDPAVRLALIIGYIVWAGVLTLLAWARLDETGKEAHKFAWFWGGAMGAFLALLVSTATLLTPVVADQVTAVVAALSRPEHGGHTSFVAGAMFIALAQVVGYGLVWTGWWLSRRMKR